MPISDVANITINLAETPATRPGFGVGVFFASLSAAQNLALFGATARGLEVTEDTWQDALTNALIPNTSDLWRALAAYFGQARTPVKAVIGRRDALVAQVETVEIINGDPVTDGLYRVNVNGVFNDFTASGNTEEEVRDALVAAINGGGASGDVTAAPSGTDILTVTSDFAGQPFTISISGPGAPDITLTSTTPNAGLDSDIRALIADGFTDFYSVHEVGHATVDILAGALEVTQNSKDMIFMGQTDDVNAQNPASSADVGSVLQSRNYQRAFLGYHPLIDEMPEAGISGKMLPTDPGSVHWGHQTLVGIPGFVPSNTSALSAKRYWWLELYAAADKTATRGIRASDGTWIDLVRGRDWLKSEIELAFLDAFLQADKIPYDEEGEEIIENVLRGVLNRAADVGLVQRDTITISVPRADQQPDADRANRNFPGVTFRATLVGAVDTLDVTGTLAP